MRSALTPAALAALAFAAPCVHAAGIQVIYTKINLHPSSQIPGPIDLDGNPAPSEWKGLENFVLSPGGTNWMLKGRTNLGSDLEHIVVLGSGMTASRFVQEGEHAPGGGPDERFENFGNNSTNAAPIGRFDENGNFAFSTRVRAAATGSADAPNGQRVVTWNGSSFSVHHKQNDPYTGVWDLVSQPGGNEPGNEFVSNTINAVHLLNNGTIGSCDTQIGNVAFTMRPGLFYNQALYHQAGGIDTVTSFGGSGDSTFAFSTGLTADRFITTPDGAHAMFVGTIAGSPSRSVLVLDNQIIIQNGQPPAPGVANVGTVTNFDLLSNGDWYAWGGYAAQGGFWAVKNGVLIARTGDPITAESSEHWGSTIYMATGNRTGDYVVAGSTDAPSATNEVIALNNSAVLAREGDMIDLDNNGQDDDNAFIGRGSNSLSAYQNAMFGVSDDGSCYFFANIHDAAGADLGSPSFFGNPNAFLRITFRGTVCEADFNGDAVLDFFDYLDFASAFDAEDISADFNGDQIVDFFDYLDFVAAFDAGCE
jgi:hypothetical protein